MSDIDEIVTPLIELRRSFLKAGIEPPEIMEFKTLRDGRRLVSLVNCCHLNEMEFQATQVQVGPDSFRYECSLAGFKIRWPVR